MDILVEVVHSLAIAFLAAVVLLMIVITYSIWTTVKGAKHFDEKLPIFTLIVGINVVTLVAIQGLFSLTT
ncbi:MAG: hypothetical protein QF858_00995 [Candidatus Pacebacteria bacterium]|jgi:hypothetical protein|nr:hypothetical protein [bacterium]MDP6527442.1 hypothetical protein [Candidatus Paceibacterota bacterium]MDP6659652.1 hypothetical protein [Candidatus Paceibacterota bacterium]|tara:strand:- start:825 stop:1034 length:210 start_codon:yes stop_codon:yes gene_type:complete